VEPGDWAHYREQLNKLWPQLGSYVVVPAMTLQQIEQVKRSLKSLDEFVRNGSVRARTEAQVTARARLLSLGAQLESGRLSPKLRAQALIDRGSQLDHLNRAEEAKADFEEAIKLDPKNADAHAALAVNALARKQFDAAEQAASKALRLAPSDTSPRYTRAYSYYYRQQYEDARNELQDILRSRSEVERSYAALWLYMAEQRKGADGVQAIKRYTPSGNKPAWPYPVLRVFNGSMSVEQADAETRDGKYNDPAKQCELYFYVGQKFLLNGDQAKAREYFQKSVDTGVTEYTEYSFAKRELEALSSR